MNTFDTPTTADISQEDIDSILAGLPDESPVKMSRTNLVMVTHSLTEFDRVSAGLADIRQRFPGDVIYPVTTTKGMADAIEHRAAYRTPRIGVETLRKAAKAPVLALGKDIDARAKWLTCELSIGENAVDSQIKAEEKRKDDIRQEKINAEIARTIAIQEAIGEIHQEVAIACTKSSEDIKKLINTMGTFACEIEVFQEQRPNAEAARLAGVEKLKVAYKAKLFDEAETKQQAEIELALSATRAAEKVELEQLRADAAKQKAANRDAEAMSFGTASSENAAAMNAPVGSSEHTQSMYEYPIHWHINSKTQPVQPVTDAEKLRAALNDYFNAADKSWLETCELAAKAGVTSVPIGPAHAEALNKFHALRAMFGIYTPIKLVQPAQPDPKGTS